MITAKEANTIATDAIQPSIDRACEYIEMCIKQSAKDGQFYCSFTISPFQYHFALENKDIKEIAERFINHGFRVKYSMFFDSIKIMWD